MTDGAALLRSWSEVWAKRLPVGICAVILLIAAGELAAA